MTLALFFSPLPCSLLLLSPPGDSGCLDMALDISIIPPPSEYLDDDDANPFETSHLLDDISVEMDPDDPLMGCSSPSSSLDHLLDESAVTGHIFEELTEASNEMTVQEIPAAKGKVLMFFWVLRLKS